MFGKLGRVFECKKMDPAGKTPGVIAFDLVSDILLKNRIRFRRVPYLQNFRETGDFEMNVETLYEAGSIYLTLTKIRSHRKCANKLS